MSGDERSIWLPQGWTEVFHLISDSQEVRIPKTFFVGWTLINRPVNLDEDYRTMREIWGYVAMI